MDIVADVAACSPIVRNMMHWLSETLTNHMGRPAYGRWIIPYEHVFDTKIVLLYFLVAANHLCCQSSRPLSNSYIEKPYYSSKMK